MEDNRQLKCIFSFSGQNIKRNSSPRVANKDVNCIVVSSASTCTESFKHIYTLPCPGPDHVYITIGWIFLLITIANGFDVLILLSLSDSKQMKNVV